MLLLRPDHDPIQPIRRRIQQRDRLELRPVKRAGIDHPRPPHPRIAEHMRVALKEIIRLLRFENFSLDRRLIAMSHGKRFATEIEFSQPPAARKPQPFRIILKSRDIPIIIPPDECDRQPGELIEHVLSTDIAAMYEIFCATAAQLP